MQVAPENISTTKFSAEIPGNYAPRAPEKVRPVTTTSSGLARWCGPMVEVPRPAPTAHPRLCDELLVSVEATDQVPPVCVNNVAPPFTPVSPGAPAASVDLNAESDRPR